MSAHKLTLVPRLILYHCPREGQESKQQERKRLVATIDGLMETVRIQLLDQAREQLLKQGVNL